MTGLQVVLLGLAYLAGATGAGLAGWLFRRKS